MSNSILLSFSKYCVFKNHLNNQKNSQTNKTWFLTSYLCIFLYTVHHVVERHFGNLGEFYASKSQEEWGCFDLSEWIPTASSHAAVFHLLKPSLSIPNSFFVWEISNWEANTLQVRGLLYNLINLGIKYAKQRLGTDQASKQQNNGANAASFVCFAFRKTI